MQYPPKKDTFYALVIWSVPIILIAFLIVSFSEALAVLFILSVLLSYWLWQSTRYEIENGELLIQCWIFRRKVNIKDIVRVKKTRNFLASYAMALDRLEITERNKDKYYLSPNDFHAFLAELKKYNPDIIIS